jgi:Phage integrase, N-terminal SAM-like domain
MELSMSDTRPVSPLRQRMIEDMAARTLNPHTQRSHISSCKRFAAWLKRSPDTATPDEVRRFQLHLIESGASICNRNRIMTGVRFLFRVTLRRHDLAAEVWHIKEPQKLPPVLSPEEVKRVLIMATSRHCRPGLRLHRHRALLVRAAEDRGFFAVAGDDPHPLDPRRDFAAVAGFKVEDGLAGGGKEIQTCIGLFLSSRRFWLLSVLCSERESSLDEVRGARARYRPGAKLAEGAA